MNYLGFNPKKKMESYIVCIVSVAIYEAENYVLPNVLLVEIETIKSEGINV